MYTCKTVHTIPYLLHEIVLQLAGQTTSAAILRTQTNEDAVILTQGCQGPWEVSTFQTDTKAA